MSDKVFRVELNRSRYIGYKEFKPGSVILRPEQFMEQRFYDVLPANVATAVDRAIAEARSHQDARSFDCAVFGHWITVHVVVREHAYLNCTVRRPVA